MLLHSCLSSPVPLKSLILDGVMKLCIDFNIVHCLGMYILCAKCEQWFMYLVAKLIKQWKELSANSLLD